MIPPCSRRRRSLATLLSLVVVLAFSGLSVLADRVAAQEGDSTVHLPADQVESLSWRLVGPASPAGRAWKVTGVESDPTTFYVATAAGGVWKTTNNGTTLEPIFDDESVASIGAVTVAPSDPDVLWVGTGEPASVRSNSWGDGVYRSEDAGRSWKHLGLTETREISAVAVHPRDPDIAYVAAMGYLWGTNSQRGVFKTSDGGESWEKVLFVNDTTGIIDLEMDPHDPKTLYASTWQRLRYGGGDMTESGPGSGIWKTVDGGGTWKRLERGLPTVDMAKSKLAVARNDSRILYAAILTGEPEREGRTNDQGGIYRSTDAGESWTRVNDMTTNYYYQHIYVDPNDDNTVWMPVFTLWRSTDGGRHFERRNLRHVHNDLHGMWIDPHDSEHMVIAGDGGVNITFDQGETWIQPPLPIGEFYAVDVDNQRPYQVYGGMQDTGHWTGPHRTYDAEGVTNHDWFKLRYIGDGMAIRPHPTDPNIVYMVQQFGNFSRLDVRTWNRRELKPDPSETRRRGLGPVRYNWTPPMIMSGHDPSVLYLGSNYVFRFTNEGEDWTAVSPDLSRQQADTLRGARDGHHSYGTLFSLSESPLEPDVLWAGADDGPVHVTRDGGETWRNVTGNLPADAPTHAVASWIEASRFVEGRAYLVYDDHTRENLRPYIYRTEDFGESWTRISEGLPPDKPVYVVREDPHNPDLLFAGTEAGVHFSLDRGRSWTRLRNNLPPTAVRTMVVHPREKDLVAGTFGRSIWTVNIAPLEELNQRTLDAPAYLFGIQPVTAFRTRYTYGTTIEQLNGDMFFRAENPPYGALIYYHLSDPLPEGVTLTVRAADGGEVIRRLKGSGQVGLHRIVWDLERANAPDEEETEQIGAVTLTEKAELRRVPPGRYTVRLEAGDEAIRRTVRVFSEAETNKQTQARPRRD